jgi:hypothetical protein
MKRNTTFTNNLRLLVFGYYKNLRCETLRLRLLVFGYYKNLRSHSEMLNKLKCVPEFIWYIRYPKQL